MDGTEAIFDLLSRIFGTSAVSLIGLAALLLIYRVSLHAVLLVGHVQPAKEKDRYHFTFIVQNLEDAEYPGPFHVRLRCLDTKCELDRKNVKVYAGPKVVSLNPVTEEKSKRVGCDLRFTCLPGFDTWRIDVYTGPTMIELSIGPEGNAPLLARALPADVRPRRLAIDQKAVTAASAGGQRTPTAELLIWTLILGISAYFSAINLIAASAGGRAVDMPGLGWLDLAVAGAFGLMLWIGFARIRRPVYPVMQGYLWQTTFVEDKCCGNPEDPPCAKK